MQATPKARSSDLDEIEYQLEQARALEHHKCSRNAPYICYKSAERWHIIQGCCNDWLCPRCGQLRAREEYGRIVHGATSLYEQGHSLFFLTFTCRGRELKLEDALQGYMLWTNRLLSTLRADAKRQRLYWCYVQVTEQQGRGHPHSHLISTYVPDDAILYEKGALLPTGDGGERKDRYAKREGLWSEYFREKNVSAGLGIECDISYINNPVAVAVYVSKYLFKSATQTEWQKGWKRVRYSHSYPKLPELTNKEAFPVVNANDWKRVAALPLVYARDEWIVDVAYARRVTNVIYKD